MKRGTEGERDFVNAITLLIARRILTGCGGSLKGICKFNPKCYCRWRVVFCELMFTCKCFCAQSQAPSETELSMMHITVHDGSEG